ncbi:hypothetical protein ACHWQZ_G015180 [Mnemiopsis leidyi]
MSLSELRVRKDREITPVSVVQSATKDNDEANYGAGRAIDMDLGTSSLAVAASDGTYWIKISLDHVHCIQEVTFVNPLTTSTWTCTEDDCNDCVGNYCQYLPLTVSTEGAPPSYFPSTSDCKYGDTVKLEMTHSSHDRLTVKEIWIIGKQGEVSTRNKLRDREGGEITPVNVEQSATKDNDEANYGAGRAIDMDLGTSSHAVAASDGEVWFKANLAQVHCIQQVTRYVNFTNSLTTDTWNCSEADCSKCLGDGCALQTLTVSIEKTATSYHPSVSDCRFGDTVKFGTSDGTLAVKELWIIGKQGRSSTW